MNVSAKRNIEIVDWPTIKHAVKKINHELYESIELMLVSSRGLFVRARYLFGDSIVSSGKLMLPNSKGDLVTINESVSTIKEILDYSSIPIGLSLNKTCEVYVDLKSRVVPLNCIYQGKYFGFFESLSNNKSVAPVWSVSAGSRSLFMLPNISDNVLFGKIKKKYRLQANVPVELIDHGRMFSELSHKAQSDWYCDILFLTKKYLLDDKKDAAPLGAHLYKFAWEQTVHVRQAHIDALCWAEFMEIIAKHGLKPSNYQINTLKHLITMQAGAYPGFAPADTKESSAPIELIQDIYINDYNLKNNLPIIMEPRILHETCKKPVYYSLSYPTIPDGNDFKNPRGIIKDIQMIEHIVSLLQHGLSKHPEHTLEKLKFKFFHLQSNGEQIISFHNLPKYDRSFLISKPGEFPVYSNFARGCIKIS